MNIIECDGCGEQFRPRNDTDRPRVRRVCIQLRHSRDLSETQKDDVSEEADVCDSCHDRLVQSLSPRAWPRAKPERAS